MRIYFSSHYFNHSLSQTGYSKKQHPIQSVFHEIETKDKGKIYERIFHLGGHASPECSPAQQTIAILDHRDPGVFSSRAESAGTITPGSKAE
jgi:hypothetical protein